MDTQILINVDAAVKQLVILSILMLIQYVLVIGAVVSDFYSGTAKAKKLGVKMSSYGYRRTIEKMKGYFNLLIALSILDTAQILSIWYLNVFEEYDIPLFTWFTSLGVLFCCFIEIKSIYEKAEDKERFQEVGELAGQIITNKKDLTKMAQALTEYMNLEDKKKEQQENK